MAFNPLSIGAASAVGSLATAVVQAGAESSSAFAAALNSAVESAAEPQNTLANGLISPGDLFASFYQNLTGKAPAASGEPLRIEDIRQNSNELLAQLKGRIQSLLEAGGIKEADVLRITQDATGSLRVAGDHPEKAQVEYLLAQDRQLTQDFSRLSGMISLVHAADAHSEFSQAYDSDPTAAVAKYAHLLDDKQDSPLEILLGE